MIIAYQDNEATKAISENIADEDALVIVRCATVNQAAHINHLLNEFVMPESWKMRTRTYLQHENGARVMLMSGDNSKQARGIRPTCEIDARFT